MEMDKVTQKTLDMIHKLLKDKNQFDDWFLCLIRIVTMTELMFTLNIK